MNHSSSNIEQNKIGNLEAIFGPGGFDASKYASNDDQPISSSEALREATRILEDNGLLISGLIEADGNFHNLNHRDDKPRKKKGFYKATVGSKGHVHMYFGSWTNKIPRQNWSSWDKHSHLMTEAERAEHQRIYKESQEQFKVEVKLRHDEAAKKASAKLSVLPPINPGDTHPYIVAKGIKAYGDVRINGGKLIIPMHDSQTGEVVSLQDIDADGKKKFTYGGKRKGAYFFIQGKLDEIAVCEGYATGCSIHEATGASVFVAFTCDNLDLIAQAARRHYEGSKITICADNDCFNENITKRLPQDNPGIRDGMKAASLINGLCVWPDFMGEEFDQNGKRRTDFNDLHQYKGLSSVAQKIATAQIPKSGKQEYRRPFTLVSASELTLNPVRQEWLIDNIIERGSLNLLFGAPGAGKSLFALDWAFCMAAGIAWHGYSTEPVDVVIIAGEGFAGLGRRLKALELKYQMKAPARLFISEQPANMISDDSVAMVAEVVGAICPKPGLIIIDTMHRNMTGDENSSQDIGRFISNVDFFFKPMGSAVLIVHHSGHGAQDRSRGSSSIRAAMDGEFAANKDGDAIILSCQKAKDFEALKPLQFSLKQIDLDWLDDDGEPLTSVYLDCAGEVSPSARAKKRRLSARDDSILNSLNDAIVAHGVEPTAEIKLMYGGFDSLSGKHQKIVNIEHWREVAYKAIVVDVNTDDARRKAFKRCRDKLFDQKYIVEHGSYVWRIYE
ncbi:AAA family ATPase [Methylicorpusculum sp.]|uniref:AAA family ATPase n=1 Tax=Methylicorpusculum sp. TaxID=2713644 RepID=UPI00272137F7|nr:AAA family ATPase [Methylicorpusculum sp.]MDO8843840.1 AAA family ATPase [Methylicorpusculum sp.]